MNDLVKKEEAGPLEMVNKMFGAESGITMADISIGRVTTQQGLSELVQDGKFKAGDIVNLLTEAKVGDEKTAFEFIPIKAFKYWIVKRGDEFVARIPATGPDELPWEEGDLKRYYHHSFYILIVADMKGKKIIMPVELPFRSTALTGSKNLSALITEDWMNGLPTWGHIYQMTCKQKQKDKNRWYVPVVKKGRATTAPEMDMAAVWSKVLDTAPKEAIKHADDKDLGKPETDTVVTPRSTPSQGPSDVNYCDPSNF